MSKPIGRLNKTLGKITKGCLREILILIINLKMLMNYGLEI